ncbi:hypothetical protein AX14_007939 [Amanita brunnescens Koide BX004]|nr:hypothetical protein AX14_007939 [Amanita brunnescens Koide BX004]
MRLTFLVAVLSLFAVAAYGAPIARDSSIDIRARALDPVVLLDRDIAEDSARRHSDRNDWDPDWRRTRQSISLPRRDIVEDPPPLRRAESNTPGQADWRRAILDDLDGEQ